MRAFIILGFLVAASSAGSLAGLAGYNYATPKLVTSGSTLVNTIGVPATTTVIGNHYGNELIGSGSGLVGSRYGSGLITSGSGILGSGITGNRGLISTGGYGSGLIGGIGGTRVISGGSRLIGGIGGTQIISGGNQLIGGGLSTGTTNVIGIPSLDSIPQTVEYSKQFFHFEAPEEHQEEGIVTKELSNVLKKNLQVVFVKAPENNAATNAALQLAKQAIEQKTDIYVLSKQNDGAQLVGQLQQIQESVPTVPDVSIVKYRTPQDLEYAKQAIQAQYENTGGSSETYNGGITPVLNYASGSSSLSTGGTILGSGLGSSGIIGGGSVLGSGLGTTTIIDNGPLVGSGIGSTNIIGTSPLLGSGITTTKIIGGTPLISSGNYALGSNKVTSISTPVTSQYLPPLKKKK